MKTSPSVTNIVKALLVAQSKMEGIVKDAKNPFFKSNYADINSMLESVVPLLNANGVIVTQPAYSTETGHFVETYLYHESGEFMASEPLKLELSKTDMQQLGSAITYGRRYSLQSLLGLRAVDDDGEKSMSRPTRILTDSDSKTGFETKSNKPEFKKTFYPKLASNSDVSGDDL